jgi:hypothetical protein
MGQPIGRMQIINSEKNSTCTPSLKKSFVFSKVFCVKRPRTYEFNILLEEE